jgi:tol-pal system protein YbgF
MKLRFVEALQVGAGLTCGLVLAGVCEARRFPGDPGSGLDHRPDAGSGTEAIRGRCSADWSRSNAFGSRRAESCGSTMRWPAFRSSRDVWPRLKKTQLAQAASIRSDLALAEANRQARVSKPSGPIEPATIMPGVPSITPTSAFNLAYNDYLNGKFDLAVTGFQRFIKDFPSTSLTPNAHYWLGESYYGQKDYIRAMQSFEHVVNEYAGNEKVPAALFKLGLSAAETGDTAKSRKYLKRVIEEYSTSDEAKLAKAKMAEIR